MAGYAIRIIIALVAYGLFLVVAPLLFGVLSLTLPANVWQLIRICAAVIALCYIVWGPTIQWRA